MSKTKQISNAAILNALLSPPYTITAAANTCGCSRQTIYNRMRDTAFLGELDEELKARQKAQQVKAAAIVELAGDTVLDVLDDAFADDASRLRAASVALRYLQERR